MSCASTQDRIAAVVAGAAGRRERLEVESHVRRCARCADAMSDLASASIALDRAYAPLREASTALSPARIRLAMRTPPPVPMAMRVSAVSRRLTEVALAAAVTAFTFVGSESVAPKPTIIDESAVDTVSPTRVSRAFDEKDFIRWIRIGRYVPSQDLVDATVTPRRVVENAPELPHQRVGLAR